VIEDAAVFWIRDVRFPGQCLEGRPPCAARIAVSRDISTGNPLCRRRASSFITCPSCPGPRGRDLDSELSSQSRPPMWPGLFHRHSPSVRNADREDAAGAGRVRAPARGNCQKSAWSRKHSEVTISFKWLVPKDGVQHEIRPLALIDGMGGRYTTASAAVLVVAEAIGSNQGVGAVPCRRPTNRGSRPPKAYFTWCRKMRSLRLPRWMLSNANTRAPLSSSGDAPETGRLSDSVSILF